MKVGIIHNPVSGKQSQQILDYTRDRLQECGCEVTLYATEYAGHATQLAREVADHVDMVVVAGGDGTIHEAVNGLVFRQVPMGIIPVGTANILGYEIGIGTNPEKAVENLLHGKTCAVNVGQTDERYFLLMVGVGFDAEVVQGLNPRLKKRIGKHAYVWSGINVLAAGLRANLNVETGGESWIAQSVVIHNVRYYGGNFKVAPDAGLQESEFVVSLFPPASRWKLMRCIRKFMAGRHDLVRGMHYFKTSQIRVGVQPDESKRPVQMDGDITGSTPISVTKAEAALPLVMPAEKIFHE